MLYSNSIKSIGLTAAAAGLSLMTCNALAAPAVASTEQSAQPRVESTSTKAAQTTWQPSEALLKKLADVPDRRRGAGSR